MTDMQAPTPTGIRARFARASAEARAANQQTWRWIALCCGVLALACAFYPTNHAQDYAQSKGGKARADVQFIEHYGRHINTVLMVAVPLLQRDAVGIAQFLQAGLASTIATHGTKYLLNDVVVDGTRLGQRPLKPNSSNNSPSGHSSLASFAAFFVARRYGWYWLLLMLPITLLTMWTRVQLDAHTISAVFAGLLIGPAICLWLVSPKKR